MRTWLSADHHFGHRNIIKYCNRPFSDVREMDEELISVWNTQVAPEDDVYYLGDFTLGDKNLASYYFSRLNGNIAILGNRWHHDKRWLEGIGIPSPNVFNSRTSNLVMVDLPIMVIDSNALNEDGDEVPAVLCHFPFEVWDRKHYGSYHFHGHSHGNLPPMHNRLDVGIDNVCKLLNQYRPLELWEAVFLANHIPIDS